MDREYAKQAAEILKAYAEGKTIQYRSKATVKYNNDWHIILNPLFDFSTVEYRVKPEPKLRPYANAEEFLVVQKEHGPNICYDKFGYNIITQINQDSIWINPYQHHQKISFGELVNYK